MTPSRAVGCVVDGNFLVGPWLVAPSLNTVSRNGTTVQLEPKVMSVLVCLAEHRGEPVSKEKLLQAVWPDTFVGEGVLVRSVFELRRVFEDDAKKPRVIQTIAKRGYRLVAPVIPVDSTAHETQGAGIAPTADSC
jgi:DNA-binding winged helix-turn-helix (wHTH) protein